MSASSRQSTRRTGSVPRCIQCQRRPVQPAKSGERIFPRRGARFIDGVRWRWFCSRSCSGRSIGCLPLSIEAARRASQMMSAKATAARVARVQALCDGAMEPDGRVPVQTLAKALLKLERYAYRRGWEAHERACRWVA